MFVIEFGTADLASTRFAISPLVEVHRSVRALADPAAQALHLPWINATRGRVADLDLEPLRALQPAGVYTPNFVHPPPSSPLAELEDELAEMLATSPERVRDEILGAYCNQNVPEVLEPFIADPQTALAALADLIRSYWQRALAPCWDRMRALLEGDVLYRARQIVDGGAQRLFADLHPSASFDGHALTIQKSFEETRRLDGSGLLLVPSIFTGPSIAAITEPPWQPTLIYPARGVGLLWEPGRPAPGALIALIGPGGRTSCARSKRRGRPASSRGHSRSRRPARRSTSPCSATPVWCAATGWGGRCCMYAPRRVTNSSRALARHRSSRRGA